MVNFTIDQIAEIMAKPDQIRNMSVIAHVDHGKSTLSDSLIARAGIIANKAAGQERYMDTRQDEKDRGITIKSTGVSLHFHYEEKDYVFNLIDSPGHIDFSSEVTAALRVTDGALVVVDTIEGVCVQTETVLRQAMQERIKPVVMVNKVDRAIVELQLDAESMYKSFFRVIERVNMVIANFNQPEMGPLEIDPTVGNVAFGSGKDCWGFTLNKFATIYAEKFKVEKSAMMKRLWGDNFYDAKNKVWTGEQVSKDGEVLKRGFVHFILDPLLKICKACLNNENEVLNKLLDVLSIKLDPTERELTNKALLRAVLKKWIEASDALMEMMVLHLPSPKAAQKYRYNYLYEGPVDDACAIAMRDCDSSGPLMMYVSKMVPTSDKGRFYAFGRVFSGKVMSGQKVRIMGPNYVPGKKIDFAEKAIQRCVVMMGRKTEPLPEVPCGNTCALIGIDENLVKTGTISDHPEAYNIRIMKYSVSPVVRVAIQPKNPSELPKLVAGMQRLAKSDPLVVCINDEETGENIIAGSGELHVEICINDLVNEYAMIEIKQSDPVVSYRETVTAVSKTAMSKSANGHNRLYCTGQPITEEFCRAIEKGEIPMRDLKEKTKILVEKFEFDKTEVPKIWGFGPDGEGPNLIVDVTSGCQFMNEIKDHMVSGFELVVRHGVLCEEPLRGVRFNVNDTTLHNDSIHRGAGQLSPATRRVLYACQLLSNPTLQEPIYLVEVTCPKDAVNDLYRLFGDRRGGIDDEVHVEGTPLVLVKGFLPVANSFKFTADMRAATSGQASPNCVFDHWETLEGDVNKIGGMLRNVVEGARKRKGLKAELPDVNTFMDKL
mgnify:CR=1 FL=1